MLMQRRWHVRKRLFLLSFIAAGFIFIPGFQTALSKDNREVELIRAIRDGESKKVDKLIKQNKDINTRDSYGWTPLMYAVLQGNIETIEKLLAQGADMNAADHDGVTPLIASIIASPQPFMIQYMPEKDRRAADVPVILIEKGADLNRADNGGNVPLLYAVIGSHAPVVAALLKRRADPNRADNYGRTPLYFINNPDKASEWAPESGALSSRNRMPYEASDESRYTPQYAAQVAKAREQANVQLKQIKARIAELLKGAGALDPHPSKIQAVARQRLDARPRRITMAGPDDPLFKVLRGMMMSGSRPEGRGYRLLVCVASNGTVKKALVVSGMPGGVSEKLQKAAFKLRYQPAMKGGQPVEDWDTIIGGFFSGPGLPEMIQ